MSANRVTAITLVGDVLGTVTIEDGNDAQMTTLVNSITDADEITLQNSTTIGGGNFDGGWLKLGVASSGLTMDNNEIYRFGSGDLIIGTSGGGNIQLSPSGPGVDIRGNLRLDYRMTMSFDATYEAIVFTFT